MTDAKGEPTPPQPPSPFTFTSESSLKDGGNVENVASNEQQFVFLHSPSAAAEYQPCVVSNAATEHNAPHSFSLKPPPVVLLSPALRFSRHQPLQPPTSLCYTQAQQSEWCNSASPSGCSYCYACVLWCAARFGQILCSRGQTALELLSWCVAAAQRRSKRLMAPIPTSQRRIGTSLCIIKRLRFSVCNKAVATDG